MRTERVITLSEGRDATVMEARVKDMRRLLALLPDSLDGVNLLEYLRPRIADVVALLDGCLRLPDGETVDDLSVSECTAVVTLWWEIHQDFFLAALGAIGAQLRADDSRATSTAPA